MDKKRIGRICVLCSALVFGLTPVIAAISYHGGNNGIQMAFFRALFPIPLLLILGQKHPWPNKHQWLTGFFIGCLSFGCTLMLYSSYEFISPGLATTLHFLYPLYVTIFDSIRQRKLPGVLRIAGLTIALIGSTLFLDFHDATGDTAGFLLAIGSGIIYAGYILFLGREAIRPLPLSRLMLLVSLSGTLLCGTIALVAGKFQLNMSASTWIYVVTVALLSSVIGSTLFQKGVRDVGETDAAMLSLFEPLTSVLFSVLLLGDRMTIVRIIGCCLILGGLLIFSAFQKPENSKEH